MKKIIVIVLAVMVLTGGLGGFAYAQVQHEPMTGSKLIGIGRVGTFQEGATTHIFRSRFAFTNPDCVSEITIDRISIIKADGTVIYEGPLLRQVVGGGEVVNSFPWPNPLGPHQSRFIVLSLYFPDPGDPDHDWMSKQEALSQEHNGYTVEIFWTKSNRRGLPLIGHGATVKNTLLPSGDEEISGYRNEMFNMNQRRIRQQD